MVSDSYKSIEYNGKDFTHSIAIVYYQLKVTPNIMYILSKVSEPIIVIQIHLRGVKVL
jgi:hypothetical protein